MALLNRIRTSGKKTIKFIKGDFTSPVLGNVWITRVATLDENTANAFIKNGYAVEHDPAADDKEVKKKGGDSPAKPESVDDDFLLGSDVQPDSFKLEDGTELQLGDVVNQAYTDSGVESYKAWNELDNEAREGHIADVVKTLALAAENTDNTSKPKDAGKGQKSKDKQHGGGNKSKRN